VTEAAMAIKLILATFEVRVAIPALALAVIDLIHRL
jgi:hypothetical protein